MPLHGALTFFWASGDSSCGGPWCPSHWAGVLPSSAWDFKSTWFQHDSCLLYLRLLLPVSQELYWCYCSGFSMMHLFFHCHTPGREEHKEIREWVGEHGPGSQKAVPSSVLTALEESEPFISSPIKQGWSFPPSPIFMLHFFHQSQSPGPKLKLPRAIKQEFKYSLGSE